jgi:hypothetical protein
MKVTAQVDRLKAFRDKPGMITQNPGHLKLKALKGLMRALRDAFPTFSLQSSA